MAKKYASGGFVGAAGTNRGSWSGDGDLGVRTGTKTGTTASNRPEARDEATSRPKAPKAPPKAMPKASPPKPKAKPGMSIKGPAARGYSNAGKPGGAGYMSTGVTAKPYDSNNSMRPGSANQEGKGDREMRKGGVVKGRKTFGKRMADGGMSMVGNMPTTGVRSKRVTAPLPKRGKPGVIEGDRGRMPGGMPGRGMGKRGNELPGRRMGQIGMLRGKRPPMTGGNGVAVKEVSPGVAPGPQDMANAKPMPMPTPGALPPSGIGRIQLPMPNVDMSQIKPMPMPAPKTFAKGGKVKGGKGSPLNRNLGLGLNAPRQVSTRTNAGMGLKGGGLARKGVGQALAKGGLVRGAGVASRGAKKPRYC